MTRYKYQKLFELSGQKGLIRSWILIRPVKKVTDPSGSGSTGLSFEAKPTFNQIDALYNTCVLGARKTEVKKCAPFS